MAKQGQHRNDAHDYAKSKGPNNPAKSVTITTGSPKKRETYRQQAYEGKDTGKQAQAAKNEWNPDTRDKPDISGSPRARESSLVNRDKGKFYTPGRYEGPDSPPRYRGLSETPSGPMTPGEQHPPEWRGDLNPHALAGQNAGPATAVAEKEASTAHALKDIHRRYSGLSDADLKQIPIVAPGTRLQQGATYVDLNNVDRGEFTATGDMIARPENAYVPKSEVDYQLWNRITGVTRPERIGEAM